MKNGVLEGFAANASEADAERFAREGRVVVFDTETTGLSEDDEIVQLAAVEIVEGRQVRTFNEYIKPAHEHFDIASDVHGITKEFLDEHGCLPSVALSRFFDFLGEDVLLVAHNLKFDMRMLRQECAVCDGCQWRLRGVMAYDTMRGAYLRHPELRYSACACGFSLEALVDEFGLDAKNSHKADDDADACAKLFLRLMRDKTAVPNAQESNPRYLKKPVAVSTAAESFGQSYRKHPSWKNFFTRPTLFNTESAD